jgi:hypothetical protein
MERRRGLKSKNPNAAHFPIFSYEDYDFQFKKAPWPIGLKSTYPEELVRRVAAAFISLQMDNSLDYTYRRYLKDAHYKMDDGSRLDLRIARAIDQRMEMLNGLISRVAKFDGKRLGEIVCEWTFFRLPFSINFIISCANRGAFFETAAIARMVLEQVAWAAKIDQYDDENVIQKESATKAIGWLAKSSPVAGRLYGWLSVHAHWAYEGHIKAWATDDEGRLSVLFATPEFKARSLALGILLSVVAERAFIGLKSDAISKALSMKDEAKSIKIDIEKFDVEDPFSFEHVPTVEELKTLLQSDALTQLATELVRLCPDDTDVNELAEMTLAVAA